MGIQQVLLAEAAAAGGGGGATSSLLDGLSGVTGAYSASRKFLTAYGGAFYSGPTSGVTALKNQTGATDLSTVGGTTITIVGAGPLSRDAVNNASTGALRCFGIPISTFFANNDGYVAVSVIASAFATNSANSYGNHGVVGDTTQGYMGCYLKNNATYLAYNYDGTDDHADISVSTSTAYVLEWWHTGGNLVGRVNGAGSGTSVASGNTQVMTGELCAFTAAPSSQKLVGSIWEIVVRSTAGTSGERDAIAAGMKSWVGA